MPQMSDDSQALATLAVKCGIESGFHDITGEYRKTSPQTKRLLLSAMGIAAQDHSEEQAALAELEREEWKEGLPPVVVAYADRPAPMQLVLPENSGDLTWELTLENGDPQSATFSFSDLPLIEKRVIDGRTLEKRTLHLPDNLPWGYHSLEIRPGGHDAALIVTPGRCWLPPGLASSSKKVWGLAVQLYLLRSNSNWGIGDFTDLHQLLEIASSSGAQLVGINPIHSMFLGHPECDSPYSASHRGLLNVLHIDIRDLPEFVRCRQACDLMKSEAFQKDLAECRAARYLQYRKVAELKLGILRLLFAQWPSTRKRQQRESFENFRRVKGELLRRACIFETLSREFQKNDASMPQWKNWPAPFQNPISPEVQKFAATHENDVGFYAWLQWLADEQLKTAVAPAKGMSVGLYGDLAVGSHPDGAEAWSNQHALAADVSIGAPPDPFSREGQNWGLPPYNPRALRRGGYSAFIDLIRANMRHRGALRVDHAMSLQHLYWVPNGHSAVEGAYVSYPLDDLLGILSLESHRNQCVIVAEDLGTVPDGFRRRIGEANLLSYRVLFFERAFGSNSFLPPSGYPKLSVAVAGNHDLPTLRSWWEALDLELKFKIGLIHGGEELQRERQQREHDRSQLLEALRAEGLVSDGEIGSSEVIVAVHAYLSRTGSLLALAQIDDITAETEPVNIPGTVDQYPNWRRRLSVSLEELATLPGFRAAAANFSDRRNS